MEVTSKIRTLFWLRDIFTYLFVGLICSVFLIFPTTKNIIIFGVLILLLTAYYYKCLRSIYRITISEKGIKLTYLITKKTEFINLNDVEKVNLIRFQGMRQARNGIKITDGYYESCLTLKNNKKIIISPDQYENYKELVRALSENITKLNEVSNGFS